LSIVPLVCHRFTSVLGSVLFRDFLYLFATGPPPSQVAPSFLRACVSSTPFLTVFKGFLRQAGSLTLPSAIDYSVMPSGNRTTATVNFAFGHWRWR